MDQSVAVASCPSQPAGVCFRLMQRSRLLLKPTHFYTVVPPVVLALIIAPFVRCYILVMKKKCCIVPLFGQHRKLEYSITVFFLSHAGGVAVGMALLAGLSTTSVQMEISQ